MTWFALINSAGIGALVIGVLLLIRSLALGKVSEMGLLFLVTGVFLEVLARFL